MTRYGLDAESRQMVVDTIRQLRRRLLPRERILEFDRDEVFPEEVIREMLGPDVGLQLLFIPEQYGGMGGGARDCCAVTREMSEICLGIATAFFAIQLGADPILVGGTEDQKERWLGAIAEGDTLVAYAVTEPEAGSNVAAIKTKADPVTGDDGAVVGYRINGTKQFISNGGAADIITVLARTPEGPTFFVIEKGTEGLTPGKGEEKHGIRASNTSPLTLTDVFVPSDQLIGEVPGQGLKQANAVFGYTRLMVAAMAQGAGDAALKIVIPYARERIQFGEPLANRQGYTHKLVIPHVVRMAAAEAYIDAIAERIDDGETDLEVEGSIAKLFATEAANRLCDDAMQALGGYGYIREFEVEKIKRDVKITCIYEGTSEIQQSIISTFRWKRTRKSKGAFYGDLAEEMEGLARTADRGAGCARLARCARAVNELINRVHEARLTRQQTVMFAVADAVTHLEVGAALARRAMGMAPDDPAAGRCRLMSRFFAAEVSTLVADRAAYVAVGSGAFGDGAEVLAAVDHSGLSVARGGVIPDADRIADMVFER